MASIHSRFRAARHVVVSVRHHDDRLDLSVRDDGKGFDVEETLRRAAKGGHLGLLGMRERVEALDDKAPLTEIEGVHVMSPGGVAEGRLLPIGKGESEPVADNATREGRAENRRVVLRRTDCDQPK